MRLNFEVRCSYLKKHAIKNPAPMLQAMCLELSYTYDLGNQVQGFKTNIAQKSEHIVRYTEDTR